MRQVNVLTDGNVMQQKWPTDQRSTRGRSDAAAGRHEPAAVEQRAACAGLSARNGTAAESAIAHRRGCVPLPLCNTSTLLVLHVLIIITMTRHPFLMNACSGVA